MKYALSLIVLFVSVASANAAVTPATWSATTVSTGTGSLASGVSINAISTSPVVGLTAGPFGPARWDAGMPLSDADVGLTVFAEVNTYQTFTFTSPLLDGTMMYIENFDSNSLADVTVVGGTATLIESSPSVSYAGGQLISSNMGFDGEGDAILQFSAGVTAISIGYHQSEGANGVFYTFAEPMSANAVPEPASAMVMAGLFGLGGTFVFLRRKKEQK